MTYTITGILYTLSLECFICIFLIAFQAVPSKKMLVYRTKITRGILAVSFILAMAGGIVWSLTDGFSIGHYFMALFPGMFLALLLIAALAGNLQKQQKVEEIIMRAEEYRLESRADTVAYTTPTISRYAVWGEKVVKFATTAPATPVDIRAYCEIRADHYYCIGYDLVNPEKKSRKEIIESIHTRLLILAALLMPTPVTPTFLWWLQYGAGENPYFDPIIYCFSIVLFGGLRKLTRNAKGIFARIMRVASVFLYYCYLLIIVKFLLADIAQVF